MQNKHPPTVLVFAGHDPSGGAGIQADIESIRALGGFPATIITTLTVQDSHNVNEVYPVPADLIRKQAEAVIADYPIAAVKIGLLGSAENAVRVAEILQQIQQTPVILDTVLAAGGGAELSSNALFESLLHQLMPLTTLTTPNSVEARRLTSEHELADCAGVLMRAGASAVLITGEHEADEQVINTLYQRNHTPSSHHWTRLPGNYHGSGCTLASAIACKMAFGHPLEEAVTQAQEFTWKCLEQALTPGKGQQIPNRCFSTH